MPDFLDPATDCGAVYHDLVAHPGAPVAEIAVRTGRREHTVRTALGELAAQDLVVAADPAADAWDAHPPTGVVEALLQRDLLRHAVARQAGADLERLYRLARSDAGHYDGLEIVEGRERFLAAVKHLHRSGRHQVRIIDMPPYYGSAADNVELEALQTGRMAEGVTYRTLYYEAAFDDPIAAPVMAREIEAGEQARILANPPLKLLIRDDDLAIVPLPGESYPDLVALLVRPSRLFDVLAGVFESLWRFAIPASVDRFGTQLDARDRQILTLMASGATDEAIARRLGLGRRTVVRRVSVLQRTLGATTRFQAGVQAARLGWL
ncbi:DNA-binding CsgD family transcriptional regulator [Streptacidiphilus sp. MAP12-33]|uniref:LuxR C-terminal-related transcriptional regulator n=1 Tax=Streptacidiphilus sp. MAP12-33 TaxID=3156266 RepID=UPI003516258D